MKIGFGAIFLVFTLAGAIYEMVSNSFSIYGVVNYLLIGFVVTTILSLLVYAIMRIARLVLERLVRRFPIGVQVLNLGEMNDGRHYENDLHTE